MDPYVWISVDLFDPNSLSDREELDLLFFYNDDFFPFVDCNMKSPFVFLIHKYIEYQGEHYCKKREACGFLILYSDHFLEGDPNLDLCIGIRKSDRQCGFMNWALDIFNYKMIGCTQEKDPFKCEYESNLSHFQVFANIPCDSFLNHSFSNNGDKVLEKDGYFRYRMGLCDEKKSAVQKVKK